MSTVTQEKKLHCPNCKSTNITVTTESSATGAVTTHHGAFSSTRISNVHRNFWICSDCGTKFRNIQSLEEEIAKTQKNPMIYFIFAAICAFLFIYLFSAAQNSIFGGFALKIYGFGALAATIIFVCLALRAKKLLAQMKVELAELKEKCFN